MFLDEIIDNFYLENDCYECKARLNRDDVNGWLKTVAGFANASGGELLVGVEDKTNKMIGFDRASADNERNFFNNKVNEHLTPRPQMKISFVRYNINDTERFVLRVQVRESVYKPVILKMKGVPSIYMRRDGFTNGATYEEIIDMSIKSKNVQYDIMPSNTKYDTGDFTCLKSYYAEHNDGKILTEKALQSMGFFDENGFLSNGAVLFSDDYADGKTEVLCSAFSGFNKGSERIVSVNRYRGNIISTINAIMEFVMMRMNHSLIKNDFSRENIDAFPYRALFEGVINAVAHRDYYLDGTQIQIDMFRDRLEITSPGGFYHGEQFGKTYNLSSIISKRRNELISSVLVCCNVMEAAGTGFDKIMEEYSDADDSHKPYISSASDHFTLVLPDLTYTEGVDNDNIQLDYAPVPNGTSHDEKILSFCYFKSRKSSEIAKHLGITDSSYFRKNTLDNLVMNQYLNKEKSGNAFVFKTNHEVVVLK